MYLFPPEQVHYYYYFLKSLARLSSQTSNTSMAVPSRSADAATIFGFVGSGRGSRLIIALPVALPARHIQNNHPSQDDLHANA
jgi:hypothetical protein